MEEWIARGYSLPLIQKAYDITVTQKNKLAWPYCSKILDNWASEGLTTLSAVEERSRRKPAARPAPPGKAAPSLSPPGSSEQEAVERMKEYLRKKRGDAGNA